MLSNSGNGIAKFEQIVIVQRYAIVLQRSKNSGYSVV